MYAQKPKSKLFADGRMSRGCMVIFVIIIAIISYATISIMINNRNFNNDQINGTFTGALSYPGLQYQMDITFDGCGHTNGTLSNGTYNEQFKGEYMFQVFDTTNSLSFSFLIDDTMFTFNCFYSDTIIGNTTMYFGSVEINGKVILTQV